MKNFFLILTVVFTLVMNAQEPTQSKIKVYTPTGNSGELASSSSNSYKWAVKTDLFGYASGEFPIIGEYRIAKKFSVEASAGFTYSFIENNFLLEEEEDSNVSMVDTKAGIGSAFRGAIKYYPSSDYDAIEGWFFGIQLFNKVNNREYVDTNDSYEAGLLEGQKDKKVKTGVSLLIGKQIFADSNVTFESFIGIGFANNKRTYSGILNEYDSDTGEYTYSAKRFETNETKPNFQVGFRIGFGN
ncbi:MAG: DUF3575 domain-containing protein [Bacteroidota bacterium]